MFSNRRPYHGLKLSIADFFREPVRYLKQSNTQESMMEKPYLVDEYPKMHLSIPDFKYKPKKRSGSFGQIADGVLPGGLAFIDYGKARCYWNTPSTGYCVEGPVVITLGAEYFWGEDFEFNIGISGDTRNVGIKKLPETEGGAWDTQDYLFTFPEDYNGIISICGYASTHTLVSQTFETKVAGMPVSLHFIGGGIMLREKGQENPAKLIGSSYGIKGDSCGCIEIESNCYPDDPGSIGYTTQQMSTDEVQNLTVTDPNPDYTYSWSISSGSGTLSPLTGTSVDYTAPSTNAECANNPTITLSVDGDVVDTIDLAINASSATSVGYDYSDIWEGGSFPDCTQTTGTCVGCYTAKAKYCSYRILNCDGSTTASGNFCGDSETITYWSCLHCADGQECPGTCPGDCVYPSNAEITQNCINTRGAEDQRTEAEKADGCCPAQLL